MISPLRSAALAAALLASVAAPCLAQDKAKDAPAVHPTAIFPLEERGTGLKGYGAKVSDILFATLVAEPDLYLVDRAELGKVIAEQGLNLSGAVKPGEAARVGQLTGAKLLVTGSVVQVDKSIYLVAKVIGTETSRVAGTSLRGKASDDLAPLAEKLAGQVAATIRLQAEKLVARPASEADRIAALKKALPGGRRPSVRVSIAERHVNLPTLDPAAETEITRFCQATGFAVADPEKGTEGMADVLITGEGFSELAGHIGPLVSVQARLEVKAVERKSGKVLFVDRQTAVVVDLTEQIAGKAALQEAAAAIAERLLPELAKG
jgi:hypothetical protein